MRVAPIGVFDPDRVQKDTREAGALPFETYRPAEVLAADDETARIIGGQVYRSDSSYGGYVQQPPGMLISMEALESVKGTSLYRENPISAVRIRVAGVTGMDEASRERVRMVAEQIKAATGLQVDLTIGSSMTPIPVTLPQTALGVPELHLKEMWTKKGVVTTIAQAIDKKSVLLFGLILASAALTVGVSASAAVRARQRELGTLATQGWPGRRLLWSVLIELGLLGLVAGVLGSLIAWPVAGMLGAVVEPWRFLLALPAAVIVALVAGVPGAIKASRMTPIDALRGTSRADARSLVPLRGPLSLGVGLLLQRPGRVVVGATAVALPVTALSVLFAIVVRFRGQAVGSLLGDSIAIQVRSADVIAAVMLGVLGVTAIAMTTWLTAVEDATTHAILRAVGWGNGRLSIAVIVQAALMGLIGCITAAGASYAVLRLLLPESLDALTKVAIPMSLGSILLCSLTAALLARSLQGDSLALRLVRE